MYVLCGLLQVQYDTRAHPSRITWCALIITGDNILFEAQRKYELWNAANTGRSSLSCYFQCPFIWVCSSPPHFIRRSIWPPLTTLGHLAGHIVCVCQFSEKNYYMDIAFLSVSDWAQNCRLLYSCLPALLLFKSQWKTHQGSDINKWTSIQQYWILAVY